MILKEKLEQKESTYVNGVQKDVKEAVLNKEKTLLKRIQVLKQMFKKADVFTRESLIEMYEYEINENKEIFGDFKK